MAAEKDIQLNTTHHAGEENDFSNRNNGDMNDVLTDEPRTVFERYINLLAIVNFGFTLQAGWETVGLTFQFALLNGGPATLVYGCIFAGIGSVAIATSLGEMASMDPTVGAQYRWSARFATKWPEFWGLLQGWITVFAWIVNVGGSLSVLSNMVQGLIIFNDVNGSYEPKRWHATLLMWAFIIVPVFCNLFLRKILNTLETVGGICHVLFFVAVIVTMATLSERSTTDFVFKTLTHDQSGWTNPGVAWSLGLLTVAFPITSFDGVLHMIDETKEPRRRVPKSMVTSVSLNAIMQFAFIICLLFCIGDFEKVSTSALPLAEVYYGATKSYAGASFMVILHGVIFSISLFNIFASVSRLVWAFARDNGLPFANFFTYVHPTLQIPLHALMLVAFICSLLALINIASATAFNALVSLPTIALYISYFIPILLLTIRKLRGMHPAYGPWKLGRWGLPINILSLVYIIYMLIWIPFPPVRPVTKDTMNYASPVVIAVILFALGDWFTTGHKRFRVPVAKPYAAYE